MNSRSAFKPPNYLREKYPTRLSRKKPVSARPLSLVSPSGSRAKKAGIAASSQKCIIIQYPSREGIELIVVSRFQTNPLLRGGFGCLYPEQATCTLRYENGTDDRIAVGYEPARKEAPAAR